MMLSAELSQRACMPSRAAAWPQVTSKLRLGQLWDHNGTLPEGVGVEYKGRTVLVEISPQDRLTGGLQQWVDPRGGHATLVGPKHVCTWSTVEQASVGVLLQCA